MKKFLVGLLTLVIVGGIGIFAFRAPLTEMLTERMTANMFVVEDLDQFDPGVAVGRPLPLLLASHNGTRVTNLNPFMGQQGAVLYAVRSVDW